MYKAKIAFSHRGKSYKQGDVITNMTEEEYPKYLRLLDLVTEKEKVNIDLSKEKEKKEITESGTEKLNISGKKKLVK